MKSKNVLAALSAASLTLATTATASALDPLDVIGSWKVQLTPVRNTCPGDKIAFSSGWGSKDVSLKSAIYTTWEIKQRPETSTFYIAADGATGISISSKEGLVLKGDSISARGEGNTALNTSSSKHTALLEATKTGDAFVGKLYATAESGSGFKACAVEFDIKMKR
jgi:hypothetical protein